MVRGILFIRNLRLEHLSSDDIEQFAAISVNTVSSVNFEFHSC